MAQGGPTEPGPRRRASCPASPTTTSTWRRPSRRPSPRSWTSTRHQLLQKRPDPPVDLVAHRTDLVQALAGRIGEIPVQIPSPRRRIGRGLVSSLYHSRRRRTPHRSRLALEGASSTPPATYSAAPSISATTAPT